ncbi:MAG: M16 family metallopeptidase [Butyrivibrio sp.]
MIRVWNLKNNIPVIYEEVPGMKSTSFGIFVKMGSSLEDKSNNGISHVIEHMLFKGTGKHDVKELADIMSDLGGTINAYTAKEVTSFYGRVLNEDLDRSMELMAEMLFESSFDDKELSKEKHVILDEIDLYEDSPEDLCHELLQKKIWHSSPYGYIISGSRRNVRSFSKQQIRDTWKLNYTAENMVISIAGGIQFKDACTIAEKYFQDVPSGSGTVYPLPEYRQSFLFKYKDTEQVHMNIAFDNVSASDIKRFPMSIINAALGGNLNARLFQKIREEMGLTYSIYSYSSSFNTAGLFHIYASMNPSQVHKVLTGIYEVLEEFRSKGMTEGELERVKKQLRTEIVLSGESATAKMNSNAKSYMVLGRVEDMDETLSKMDEVTVEDINTCLEEYFDPDDCSMAVIGDLSDDDIKALRKIWSHKKPDTADRRIK